MLGHGSQVEEACRLKSAAVSTTDSSIKTSLCCWITTPPGAVGNHNRQPRARRGVDTLGTLPGFRHLELANLELDEAGPDGCIPHPQQVKDIIVSGSFERGTDMASPSQSRAELPTRSHMTARLRPRDGRRSPKIDAAQARVSTSIVRASYAGSHSCLWLEVPITHSLICCPETA